MAAMATRVLVRRRVEQEKGPAIEHEAHGQAGVQETDRDGAVRR